MNFLQLVQALHHEAGLQGAPPATVVNPTGMAAKLVRWINTAYADVQNEHETWLFRQKEFSFNTVAGTQDYSPVGVGINDLQSWKVGLNPARASGIRLYSSVSDEQDLFFAPWQLFRDTYNYGSFRTQSGRPTVVTIAPDKTLKLWPTPDAIYTVNGEYVLAADQMSINADEPIIPESQMVIVWKALMLYGAFEGAADVYAHGKSEHRKALGKLSVSQLPKMGFGAPLA
jgi:hypothetical protein